MMLSPGKKKEETAKANLEDNVKNMIGRIRDLVAI